MILVYTRVSTGNRNDYTTLYIIIDTFVTLISERVYIWYMCPSHGLVRLSAFRWALYEGFSHLPPVPNGLLLLLPGSPGGK